MRLRVCSSALASAALTVGLAAAAPPAEAGGQKPFLDRFNTVSTVASTVPENGDVNPYGTFTIRESTGDLHRGNILVSNFNNSANPPAGEQGRGTTLVQITPGGARTTFATIDPNNLPGPCPGGVGLTTALTVLPGGWVVVGSLPTADGTSDTAQAGCLLVLDKHGTVRETIAGDGINGPWDLTAVNHGDRSELFVTNVLNGTVASGETPVDEGTVVRIGVRIHDHGAPQFGAPETIATGFPERTDPVALVVGPTGVGLGAEGTLYVADTQDSRIAAVPDALSRQAPQGEGGITVAAGGYLKSPLGMTIAPNGDVLTANGGDGNLVETTPAGAEFQPFDTGAGEGGLFGLTVAPHNQGVLFVNDTENKLDLLH
jgi:hypothetical protein